jgi:hypothetical protein
MIQFDKLNNEFQIVHELGIRTSPFDSNFLWLTQASIEVPAEPCNIGSGHPSPGAGRYITSGGLICKVYIVAHCECQACRMGHVSATLEELWFPPVKENYV